MSTAAPTLTHITRDAILALPRHNNIIGSFADRWLESDSGVSYRILNVTDGVGYALSENTGLVVRFVVTGKRRASTWKLRVRVEYPTDTGDLAGTLEFSKANSMGGHVNCNLYLI